MIDPQQAAREHLRPDEHLYWAGTSDPAKLFSGRDGFLIPFSLLWCGFVGFGTVSVLRDGQIGPELVIFPLFLVLGLHLLFGRFLVKLHRKRTTVYAVTDRRALVITARGTRDVPVGRSDRTTRWSADRQHCTVEWQEQFGPFAGVTRGLQTQIYANTGLDGFFGPQLVAFWDVRDGEELVRALELATR